MENYLEKNWIKYLENLKALIKIPSFLVTEEDYPNVHNIETLKYMEDLAKENGMKVFTNPEGYYGYIEIGQGEEMIGLLAHLDVVAPGELESWDTNPFELVVDGDKLIGRGTSDDKGPLLLSFYLMKEMLESGITLNKRIRLIYATDEESFWRGIDKYVSDGNEQPTLGWTPDAAFPPIYGEKTVYRYQLSLKENHDFEFNGGVGVNIVSPKATYKGNKVAEVQAKMDEFGYEYQINDDGSISALGVSAHAMKAATEGVNANARLIKAVVAVEDSKFLNFLNKYIGTETTGDSMYKEHFEDETGPNTCNLGVVKTTEEGFSALIDTRIPIFAPSWQELEKIVKGICEDEGIEYEIYKVLEKIYFDKNDSFIQILLDAYKKFSGDVDAEPVVIGGGTYARSMSNIIGFGPFFKDSPDTEHQSNEYARKSDFIKAYSVYAHVFEVLLK